MQSRSSRENMGDFIGSEEELSGDLKVLRDIQPSLKMTDAWESALGRETERILAKKSLLQSVRRGILNPWAVGFVVNAVAAIAIVLMLPLNVNHTPGYEVVMNVDKAGENTLISRLRNFSWGSSGRYTLAHTYRGSEIRAVFPAVYQSDLREIGRQLSEQAGVRNCLVQPVYTKSRKSIFRHIFDGDEGGYRDDIGVLNRLFSNHVELVALQNGSGRIERGSSLSGGYSNSFRKSPLKVMEVNLGK